MSGFDKALKSVVKINCNIEVLTGLHIGGSKDNIEIGGIDNIVIKLHFYNGHRDVPYIPGSSLKGKMRALLEWVEKPMDNSSKVIALAKNGKPCDCGKCNVCRLFGAHQSKNAVEPVRLRVDDFCPTEDTINTWTNVLEGLYTEIKTENIIDRIKGTAEHPRHTERVIPGSVFEGSISIRIYEGDTFENTVGVVLKSLEMIEDDYLGGSGSRGYGRVRFDKKSFVLKKYTPNLEEISFEKVEDLKGKF